MKSATSSPLVKYTFAAIISVATIGAAPAFVAYAEPNSDASTSTAMFQVAPAPPIRVGKGSGTLFMRDFNRDGHTDLLTTLPLERQVVVRFGNGAGEFPDSGSQTTKFTFGIGAIDVGDVNGDGRLDLCVTHRDKHHEFINIFLGSEAGRFSELPDSQITSADSISTFKSSLELVDLNGDGHLDLLAGNARRNVVGVFLGTGGGHFSTLPPLEMEAGHDWYSHAVGDVDNDGHADLVYVAANDSDRVGSGKPGVVIVKRGDGHGGFSAGNYSKFSTGIDARLQALADLDKNERLDLVLSENEGKRLFLNVHAEDQSFPPALGARPEVDLPIFSVVPSDLNGDQRTDLVVATVDSRHSPCPSKVAVLLNDGSHFTPAAGSPYSVGNGAYRIAVADVNEDGRPDIAASSFEGEIVTLLLNADGGPRLTTPRAKSDE